jgi:hypothetical protein
MKNKLMTVEDLKYVTRRLDNNDFTIANIVQKVFFITEFSSGLFYLIYLSLIRLINSSCFLS